MTGFVYAIAAGNGLVKIGWSADPMRRLVKIRSDCPAVATLLGVVPATRKQESELHALLRPWKRNGEWFERSHVVQAFLDMLPPVQPREVDWGWKTLRTDHPLAHWIDARMTRRDFARMAGTPAAHLSCILNRKRLPSLQLAGKFSQLTNGEIPVGAFVEMSAEPARAAQ